MSRVTKAFERELNLIKDVGFRDQVIEIIEGAPDYIVEIPSASTGKYHPRDEINPMGMIYHVKRCVIMAQQISNIRKHTNDEQDILIASCVLHDLIKCGDPQGKWTVKNHEILAYNEIHKHYEDYALACADDPDYDISDVRKDKMFLTSVCVLLHTGQWTPAGALEEYKNICKEIRFNETEKKLFESMHLVDCIVSRRAVADMFQPEWWKGKSGMSKMNFDWLEAKDGVKTIRIDGYGIPDKNGNLPEDKRRNIENTKGEWDASERIIVNDFQINDWTLSAVLITSKVRFLGTLDGEYGESLYEELCRYVDYVDEKYPREGS